MKSNDLSKSGDCALRVQTAEVTTRDVMQSSWSMVERSTACCQNTQQLHQVKSWVVRPESFLFRRTSSNISAHLFMFVCCFRDVFFVSIPKRTTSVCLQVVVCFESCYHRAHDDSATKRGLFPNKHSQPPTAVHVVVVNTNEHVT